MEVQPSSPQTTLLILLGASEWPLFPEFQSSKAFANAVKGVRDYFLDPRRFGIPVENMLDAFDSKSTSDELDAQIGQFLEQRLATMKATGQGARDLLVYFVGHGGFVGRDADFYLAIRRTRMENPRASGLSVLALADTLTEKARYLRRIIILDCCFAAAAFSAFQAGPAQVAIEKTIDAFEVKQRRGGFPVKGTTLLCSSGHKSPSLLLPDGSSTMFTKAALEVLVEGIPSQQDRLSLREVKDLAADLLSGTRNAPKPAVLSPDQSEGDVADIPFFPNSYVERERARLVEKERRRQAKEAEQAHKIEQEKRRQAEEERARQEKEEADKLEEERVRKVRNTMRALELNPNTLNNADSAMPQTFATTDDLGPLPSSPASPASPAPYEDVSGPTQAIPPPPSDNDAMSAVAAANNIIELPRRSKPTTPLPQRTPDPAPVVPPVRAASPVTEPEPTPKNLPPRRTSGKIPAVGLAAGAAMLGGATATNAVTPPRIRTGTTGTIARAGTASGAAATTVPRTGGGANVPPRSTPPGRGGGGGGGPANRRRGLLLILLIGLIIALLVFGGILVFARPGSSNNPLPDDLKGQVPATVTITPDSRTVEDIYTIVGASTTNVKERQTAVRMALGSAQAPTERVNATGRGSSYTFLKQSDVNGAISQATKDATKQNALTDLQKQVKSTERQIGTTQCTPTTSVDQPVGDTGSDVTSANATYLIKCTATVYDSQGAQNITQGLLTTKASTSPGVGYGLVGAIQTSLTGQTKTGNSLSLLFSAKGIWVYQFTDAQKLQLAKAIAGKSIAETQSILNGTKGIGSAKIDYIGGNTLPTNPNQISIVIQPISGLPDSGSGSPTVTR